MDFLLCNSFIVATQGKLQREEDGAGDSDYPVAPTQLGKVGGDSTVPSTDSCWVILPYVDFHCANKNGVDADTRVMRPLTFPLLRQPWR